MVIWKSLEHSSETEIFKEEALIPRVQSIKFHLLVSQILTNNSLKF